MNTAASLSGYRTVAEWKANFVDTRLLEGHADGLAIKLLLRLAAAVRLTPRRSLRRRRSPSRPGTPPSSPTGRLREGIVYALDRSASMAVIGVLPFAGSVVPALHEFGGTRPADPDRASFDALSGLPPERRAELFAKASRAGLRITQYLRRHPIPGAAATSRPRVYPARPYMRPALEATQLNPKYSPVFQQLGV